MPVQSKLSDDQKELTILIDGEFDFSIRKEFRDAYESADNKIRKLTVDLLMTKYLDSSALGMLLLLKEHADNLNCQIAIKNPNPVVQELLDLSNFGQLFEIS